MKIALSSGHGLLVRGAKSLIDEVDEARKVVNRMQCHDPTIPIFHDDISTNVSDNISAIVSWHNAQQRDIDVSIHFNASGDIRDAGIGVETLYREGNNETKQIATQVSTAISNASGLILRRGDGTWGRTGLGFLERTHKPAFIVEVCFVNSRTDVSLYRSNFDKICRAILDVFSDAAPELPKLIWPVEGFGRITSPFGMRTLSGVTAMHNGIDIGRNTNPNQPIDGQPVLAADAGTVIRSNFHFSSGHWIQIDHGQGLITGYMHNAVNIAHDRQTVRKGDVIARVGNTGNSTGAHLHFETILNSVHVDPLRFVTPPTTTVPLSSITQYAVIVGTHSDRSAAILESQKLQRAGFDTWVREEHNRWIIQTGVFSTKDNARTQAIKLELARFVPHIVKR